MAVNRYSESRTPEERREIFCDCCGREKLGEIRGDKLVIMDRRHGKKHIAVIALSDLTPARAPVAVPPRQHDPKL